MNSNYARRENENRLDYAMRLIGIKKELKPGDLDWCDIVELLGLDYNPDSLRKAQDSEFGGLAVYREMQKRGSQEIDKGLSTDLQELKKMRCEIADERAELNKLIREQSRADYLKELAVACVKEMQPLELVLSPEPRHSGKSLLLTLSDFHYGLEIKEFNNEYSATIFRDRMNILYNKVAKIVSEQSLDSIIVVGLGDYISGLIHNVIRIESRENTVEQVIAVSDAMATFLNELSKLNNEIHYLDCIGNHSRLFEDKKNCLSKESFDLLIHYILEQRFLENPNIEIHPYTINERIGKFNVYGKKYGFCHGDNFNLDTIAKDFSAMTKEFYTAIFVGHIHHLFLEEQNETLVIANSSFAGSDEFSNKIRKTSVPSQNAFVVSENGIDSIINIKLV